MEKPDSTSVKSFIADLMSCGYAPGNRLYRSWYG
jgi:hypothetical protein